MYNYLKGLFLFFVFCAGLCKKSKTVVLTGLDNAGKTTLLHILTMDRHGTTIYPSKLCMLTEDTLLTQGRILKGS